MRPTFVSSSSKIHGRSDSTGSLRGGNSVELALQPARSSPELVGWSEGGRAGVNAYEKEKQVTVTSAYVPMDEESGTAWCEGSEGSEGENGIRKTVRIEQSS